MRGASETPAEPQPNFVGKMIRVSSVVAYITKQDRLMVLGERASGTSFSAFVHSVVALPTTSRLARVCAQSLWEVLLTRGEDLSRARWHGLGQYLLLPDETDRSTEERLVDAEQRLRLALGRPEIATLEELTALVEVASWVERANDDTGSPPREPTAGENLALRIRWIDTFLLPRGETNARTLAQLVEPGDRGLVRLLPAEWYRGSYQDEPASSLEGTTALKAMWADLVANELAVESLRVYEVHGDDYDPPRELLAAPVRAAGGQGHLVQFDAAGKVKITVRNNTDRPYRLWVANLGAP